MQMKPLLAAVLLACAATTAFAAADRTEPKEVNWPFDGVFGKFDRPAVQRGFQVYKEVCAACHSLKRVPFRKLEEIGFSAAEVKSLAAGYTVKDGPNDSGEMFDRPGRPSDTFPSPYANDKAARASNNGALPPDQSLLVKAREDGANYIYSLLTGYADAPAYRCKEVDSEQNKCVAFEAITADEAKAATAADEAAAAATKKDAKDAKAAEPEAPKTVTVGQVFFCSDVSDKVEEKKDEHGKVTKVKTQECREMGVGMHYNPYFPGKQIAMPKPIADEQVTYQDGTKATLDQESKDIVSFLQWAAEPEMEERKHMGVKVMLFLGVMTAFFYVAKKRIWSQLD